MEKIEEEYYRRLALQEEYGGIFKPANKIKPLVSVVTTTYQHAPYIQKCLDGILMQETDFSYEVIIGEDGSTDGTREICVEYAKKYPDKIRLFLRDRTLSHYVKDDGNDVMFNALFTVSEARGQYIAFCEGDDAWIDKWKLKKQVQILEDAKYSMCFTAYLGSDKEKRVVVEKADQYNFRDMLKRNLMGTLTVMFRAELLPKFEADWDTLWCGDLPLWIRISKNGRVYNLKDPTAIHYENPKGLSKVIKYQKKHDDMLKLCSILESRYGPGYKNALAIRRARIYCYYSSSLFDNGAWVLAMRFFIRSLRTMMSSDTLTIQAKCLAHFLVLLPKAGIRYLLHGVSRRN